MGDREGRALTPLASGESYSGAALSPGQGSPAPAPPQGPSTADPAVPLPQKSGRGIGEGSFETGGGGSPSPAARVPGGSAFAPPKTALAGDHLITVRAAVARSLEADGLSGLAVRTRAGEMDQGPMMCAAMAAVSAVLKGMFE